MMYILNDYSIDNQFKDIEDLLDSLVYHTIPLLKLMDRYNLELLKNHEIYELKIARNLSVFELLNLRGYPEITRFKSVLHKRFFDNPYWEKEDVNYDCMDEACKRNVGLISFEHHHYLKNQVEYKVGCVLKNIPNSYNRNQLIEGLWESQVIDISEYLEGKYSTIQSFCIVEEKDYFNKMIRNNDLNQYEIKKIAGDLTIFMYKYLHDQDLGRLSKNLETNLHEFRTTLSDSKEIRIFYCLNKGKLRFLNCFIKKQQKTPENEKVLARRLRNIVIDK